jgi:hypothetical protein
VEGAATGFVRPSRSSKQSQLARTGLPLGHFGVGAEDPEGRGASEREDRDHAAVVSRVSVLGDAAGASG